MSGNDLSPFRKRPERRVALDSAASSSKLIAQAVCLQQSGRLQEASRLYEAVLRRDPSNSDALRLLAVVFAQQGKLETAAQTMQRALINNPLSPETHNNLGRVQQELKQFDAAADL
jgi:Tfp pilus assembly protein PilF